jgi:hypothetical protein
MDANWIELAQIPVAVVCEEGNKERSFVERQIFTNWMTTNTSKTPCNMELTSVNTL